MSTKNFQSVLASSVCPACTGHPLLIAALQRRLHTLAAWKAPSCLPLPNQTKVCTCECTLGTRGGVAISRAARPENGNLGHSWDRGLDFCCHGRIVVRAGAQSRKATSPRLLTPEGN